MSGPAYKTCQRALPVLIKVAIQYVTFLGGLTWKKLTTYNWILQHFVFYPASSSMAWRTKVKRRRINWNNKQICHCQTMPPPYLFHSVSLHSHPKFIFHLFRVAMFILSQSAWVWTGFCFLKKREIKQFHRFVCLLPPQTTTLCKLLSLPSHIAQHSLSWLLNNRFNHSSAAIKAITSQPNVFFSF